MRRQCKAVDKETDIRCQNRRGHLERGEMHWWEFDFGDGVEHHQWAHTGEIARVPEAPGPIDPTVKGPDPALWPDRDAER